MCAVSLISIMKRRGLLQRTAIAAPAVVTPGSPDFMIGVEPYAMVPFADKNMRDRHDPEACLGLPIGPLTAPVRDRLRARTTHLRFIALTLVLIYLAPLERARAPTFQVGPARAYHAVGSLPALNPGDVVEIDPATYKEVKRALAAARSQAIAMALGF